MRAKLEGARGKIVGVFVPDRVELVPHPAKAHFWSPQLSLEFSEGDDGTLICARFGPHPPVWTLYMGIHAVGAFSTLGAAIFGMSQHMAGESPWALWALPVSPLLAALVWALAFIGQNLGAEQMYMLRKFLDESLDDDAVPDETAE
ncbi:MAG: hypothetical protein R3B13_05165 [Polyangiaceae bacterium]